MWYMCGYTTVVAVLWVGESLYLKKTDSLMMIP